MHHVQSVAAGFARVLEGLQGLRPHRIGLADREEPLVEGGIKVGRREAGAERDPFRHRPRSVKARSG
jgi:hypothetical protein